jgi:hypothetical protein
MKSKISLLILSLAVVFAIGSGYDNNPAYDKIGNEPNLIYSQDVQPTYRVPVWDSPLAIVFNQDSLITHLGQGANGANVSAIPTTTNTLYGFGAQGSLDYWMADDFDIPSGQTWHIDSVKHYSYQTGSTTTSTITGSKCYITLGRVDSTGSVIVAGDIAANRMIRTYFTGIYRTNNPPPYNTQTTRPIMAVSDTIACDLPTGYYWVVYNFNGTLSSGPWNPPYTIWNQTGSGNARQKTTAWAPALDGALTQSACFKIYGSVITGVSNTNNEVPSSYKLEQNYPNPFNPSTKINFSLPKASNVKIVVYDAFGREVKTLVNESKAAGNYKVEFNAANISSGIYFYKIVTDNFTDTKKMILVK